MAVETYDFSGWATKNDLKCSDGRTIRRNAFKDDDGRIVPLVWQHQHNSPENVLGHALLVNTEDGVYTYGKFNNTDMGIQAKQLVEAGDVKSLSIYANKLKQSGGNVLHGAIKEVSLVLAGANPGAMIDHPILRHSDGEVTEIDDEAYILTGELIHSEFGAIEFTEKTQPIAEEEATEEAEETLVHEDSKEEGETKVAENSEKTIQDVVDSMNEEQKKVLYFLVGKAVEEAGGADNDEVEHADDEGENFMKYNVFDNESGYDDRDYLSHEEMETIINDGKRFGSLKDSFLAHADEYGITNIDYLFPDAQTLNDRPEFIKRDTTWVSKVMGAVHHTPFSRIKSVFADITEDDARARGYIKGNLKKEEVFSLLKRTTTPQTVYKKQKLDRDDVIDITDFDVVAWLKAEMRMMLDEELARAFLFGDGRLSSSDDKINETNIRPILTDAALYTIVTEITAGSTDDDTAKAIIRAAITSRKDYKGTGNPTFFTTEGVLCNMLLLEDGIGHPLYKTEAELATKMRVKDIVTVPDEIMPDGYYGLIVNLSDYNVGADKGGAVSMFDDFDIDYNQQKYLIETRCSGALTKPYSAIALKAAAEEVVGG